MGSCLFNVFIDDTDECAVGNTNIIKFADDTKSWRITDREKYTGLQQLKIIYALGKLQETSITGIDIPIINCTSNMYKHLESSSPAWKPWQTEDKAVLEKVQEKDLQANGGPEREET